MSQVTLFVMGVARNPLKVAILLEELDVDYKAVTKDRGDGPNGIKAPDFLKINPNGVLPALIDHTNNDHIVWESGAILLYIAERFDPTRIIFGKTIEERTQVWEWIFFQVSTLGFTQNQLNRLLRRQPIKDLHPSVIELFQNETYKSYVILEKQLQEGDWIVLNRFTVADISIYPLGINLSEYPELSLDGFPKLQAYYTRMKALPSVQRAYARIIPGIE
ncbi:glutathione S-transferase [Ramaria rubella]|nr:glutathione S-transferase [Ramaria rubella]